MDGQIKVGSKVRIIYEPDGGYVATWHPTENRHVRLGDIVTITMIEGSICYWDSVYPAPSAYNPPRLRSSSLQLIPDSADEIPVAHLGAFLDALERIP